MTTDTHPEKGRGLGASQAGKGRHAVRVVWTGWTLQSTLWAIQACSWQRPHWQQPRECVEMTPPGRRRSPLLTLAGKWSSSSGTINGDRLLRGSGGQCGGGAAGAEVKQHTDPKRGKAAQRGYTHTHTIRTGKRQFGPVPPQRRRTTRSYTTPQQSDTTGVKQMVHVNTYNNRVTYTQLSSWSHYHTNSSLHHHRASYHNG